MHKIIIAGITIAGIAMIIVVFVVGMVFWRLKDAQKKAHDRTNKSAEVVLEYKEGDFEKFIKEHGEEVKLDPVDTTNWQTYTDNERGFSFKYPQDWTLEQKTYEKQKQYKDCYDALGDSGVCDDYDVKALIQNDTFLCLAPWDHAGECYIRFEDLTPRVAHVSSVWEMYFRTYMENWEYFATKNLYHKYYIGDHDKIYLVMGTIIDTTVLTSKNYTIRIINGKAIRENFRVAQKTDSNDFSYYKIHDENLFFRVPKFIEQPYFGILQSLTFE